MLSGVRSGVLEVRNPSCTVALTIQNSVGIDLSTVQLSDHGILRLVLGIGSRFLQLAPFLANSRASPVLLM